MPALIPEPDIMTDSAEINTPHYTALEEFLNSGLHLLGALLAVAGTYDLVSRAASPSAVVTALLYGVCIFEMYLASTVYHAIDDQEVKSAARKFDHALIYFAIAGTFLPIVNAVVPFSQRYVWYGALLVVSLLGAVFSFITLKFRHLTTIIYLIMGWSAVFLIRFLWIGAAHSATWFLLGGGIAYSTGAALYLIRTKYMHSVFHVFVLAGTILQFFAIRILYL